MRNSFQYVSDFLIFARVTFFGLPVVFILGLERNSSSPDPRHCNIKVLLMIISTSINGVPDRMPSTLQSMLQELHFYVQRN